MDVHPALGNNVLLIPTSRNSASFMIDRLDGITKIRREAGWMIGARRRVVGQILTCWRSRCLDGRPRCFGFCCRARRRLDRCRLGEKGVHGRGKRSVRGREGRTSWGLTTIYIRPARDARSHHDQRSAQVQYDQKQSKTRTATHN